ncbi:metal-dependent hydrolase [Streptomyces sp. IBSNAI002]|uniref:metal-dependent hydrolase n=1 Tax=Streptomyces sp. IBSNAI002 TaxID=3457500 RepID=UPI003FD522E4
MLGPAHALSGAAAWAGFGALAAAGGHAMPWPVLVGGAIICAGAALAPDLDHPAATISRSFGPLSAWLSKAIGILSHAVYSSTRGPEDPARTGGHRTLTHTALFAVTLGFLVSHAASFGGRWAVFGVLFVHLVLGVEGLLWKAARSSSRVLVWLLGAAAAWLLADLLHRPGLGGDWLFTAPGQELMWLGLPVALGAVVHCLGDALTISGCPVLWPLPIRGRLWFPLGPPGPMRFAAGSWVEQRVLMPVFAVLALALGGVAYAFS